MTLDRLIAALPAGTGLMPLKQALLRASTVDATRAWSRATAYATFDKRTISPASISSVVAEAAAEERARIDFVYAQITRVLEHVTRGDNVAACEALIEIGEHAESNENAIDALAFFAVAAQFAEGLPDRQHRVLALRRCGRANLAIGDFEAAISAYRAAAEQAVVAGDVEGQIMALNGLGNVLSLQGRWDEAFEQYQHGSGLCGGSYPRLRNQLAINLSAVERERGNLAEAATLLDSVSGPWEELSAEEHSAFFNYHGLLFLAMGDFNTAEPLFRQALELAANDFQRAMILDSLTELLIVQGSLNEAEACARAAEECAVRVGSPRALAEIYTRLGKIFRLRSDLSGVTFFEKALELCRGRTYPLIEANAYREYGQFRDIMGDHDEARSYFERARQLYAEIGVAQP